MLARKYRLSVFKTTEKPQKVFRSPHFLLKIFKNNIGHNRFGLVVGSNVEKKAVVRNYWKRRLRAFFAARPDLSGDFLLILSPAAKIATPRGVISELEKIFGELVSSGKNGEASHSRPAK